MAGGQAVDDWKDVDESDWKDVSAPTPKPTTTQSEVVGNFQTQPGGKLYNQNSLMNAEPITYPTQAAATGGAQARAALPEFPQQLQKSEDTAASYAPTIGATIGSPFGLGASALGAGAGRLAEPAIRGEGAPGWSDAGGAAIDTGVTYAGGKAIESLAPIGARILKPSLARGVARDVAAKYISPRLADAILPEAPEAIDPLAQAISEGRANKIPTTIKPAKAAPSELDRAIAEGRAAKIPIRVPTPKETPSELEMAISEGRANKIPTKIPAPKPAPSELETAVAEGRANKIPTKIKPQPSDLDVALKEGRANKVPTKVMTDAEREQAASKTINNAETARQQELADAERLKEQHAAALNNRGESGGLNTRESLMQQSPTATEPGFSGKEGRPATWSNERVMELAKKGNREAIQQLTRRGIELPPNARYIAGDQDFPRSTYNPRESTKFTPEGTPIRNMAKVAKGSRARIIVP